MAFHAICPFQLQAEVVLDFELLEITNDAIRRSRQLNYYTLPFHLQVLLKDTKFSPSRRNTNRLHLTGGSPFKAIFDVLSSTIHRDTIATPIVEATAKPLRQAIDRFPYAIPNEHKVFLSFNGITIAGFGTKSHPHPVHKTLEINLLHNHWHDPMQQPSSVMFMKPSKFKKLQTHSTGLKELLNYHLTPEDKHRYPETSVTLPSCPQLFLHDALMYFKPSQILDLFTSCPNLERCYASLVVPPESDFTNISLRPDLYNYHFIQDKLVYHLEKNPAHSYTQPRTALDWLKTSQIIGPDFTLSVSILDSWGPMHSILISRGTTPCSSPYDTKSFEVPDAILLPEPNDLKQDLRHRLVPRSVYQALFTYVRAVRTLRVTDPAGFIRTQSNKPEYNWVTSCAWDNLQHFSLHTSPHRPVSHYMLFRSPFQRFKHWAKTNESFLFSLSCAAASPVAALATYYTTRLFNSQIVSFAFLRHWFVQPPFSLFPLKDLVHPPPVPLFRLTLEPRQTFPLGLRCLKHLVPALPPRFCDLLPFVKKFLPHQLPFFARALPCFAAAVPAVIWLHHRIFGTDTPQTLHDDYIRYFHPEPYTLTFQRKPVTCDPETFLPIPTHPTEHVPSPHAAAPLPISDISTPPPKLTLPEPEAPTALFSVEQVAPSNPESPPPPLKSQPEPSVTPLSASDSETPPESEGAIEATPVTPAPSSTIPPAVTFVSVPRTKPAPSPPSLSEPSGPQKPTLVMKDPLMGSERPPPVDRHGVITEHPTPPPAAELPYSPLLSDPSAAGPIVTWTELSRASLTANAGEFLTRARNDPASKIPYPPTNDCLLIAVSDGISVTTQALWQALCSQLPDSFLQHSDIIKRGLTTDHLAVLATVFSFSTNLIHNNSVTVFGVTNPSHTITIQHTPDGLGHFSHVPDPEPPLASGASTDHLRHLALGFRDSTNHLLPFQTVHRYTSVVRRAKNLISNMKNGFDGIMANVDPLHPNKARDSFLTLDLALDIASPRQVDLIHIAGFAGCGKSFPIQQLLGTPAFSNFRVAVPSTELRSEWKSALSLPSSQSWRVGTWESSLLKSARVLVIDEIYKMPRGYIDLCIHADPALDFIIALGDPIQGEYHSSNPNSNNHKIIPETRHLRRYVDFYCFWTRRLPKNIATFFDVHTLSSEPGFVKYLPSYPMAFPLLVNSQATAAVIQNCGAKAITIASSQGATYSTPVSIHLDKNSRLLSLQNSLVALTRSKKGVYFTGNSDLLKMSSTSNLMFSRLFTGQTFNLFHHFQSLLQGFRVITSPLSSRSFQLAGANSTPILPSVSHQSLADVIITAKVFSGDGTDAQPQVSTHFLPETRRPLHLDIPSAAVSSPAASSVETSSSPFTQVYPGETFENLAAHFLPPHDPEAKEIFFQGLISNQFPWVDQKFELACQPSSLLAAIHRSKEDATLLPASLHKRLRFRSSKSPYHLSPKDEILGTILYNSLCRAYNRAQDVVVPFDEALFVECINANEYAQLSSKTQNVIASNAFRSDPDWRWSAVRIFSKTQHKVNESSIFGGWKACQTLALMHDAVILALGPVKKYQRIFDRRDRPDNIYVHASHTPADMARWCQQHLTRSTHLANDYTAFDQSQHGEAVVLERKKMERLSIPESLINLHLHLKTNVQTQFGPLTCMRLTGEPGTYDDNTDYNLAVLFSEYAITSEGVMVSGDDSLLDSEPPTLPSWSAVQPLLSLTFKKERSPYALFCGYYVGPEGAVRSPLALFAKLMVAIDSEDIDNAYLSYLTEFSIGHSLGEEMWNLIPLHQVPFQSAIFDYFCRTASRSLKVAFQLGEVPASFLNSIFPNLKKVSSAVWSMLSVAQRALFVRSSRPTSSTHFPHSLSSDGELLQTVPFDNLTVSQPADFVNHPYPNSVYTQKASSDRILSERVFLTGGSAPMALPSLEALLAILPALKSLSPLPFATTSNVPPPSPSDPSAPRPGSEGSDRVLSGPSLPSPARALFKPDTPAGVTLPFQWNFADISGIETKSASVSVAADPHLTKLCELHRHAQLVELEVMIAPTHNSMKYPQCVELVWCTSNLTITEGDIMSTFGSLRAAIGGPLNMPTQSTHPADLRSINPVIKDSVTYNDTPRLCVRFYQNPDCVALGNKAPICASLFIRGKVLLSNPAITPTTK